MKRKLCGLMAAVLLICSCSSAADRGMVSATGRISASSSSQSQSQSTVSGGVEYPDSKSSLPSPSSSKPPTSSSESPKSSSEAPKSSSEAPKSSSEAPKSSSEAPKSSSEAPKSSSEAPKSSSEAPKSSSEAPKSSSEAPKSSSEAPKSSSTDPMETETIKPTATSTSVPDEVSAVWISYLEFVTMAKGQSQSGFTKNIDSMFQTCASFGLNTVFVQVRPFGDAMYPSEYFPWSYVMTGKEGGDPGYDPLDIMVKKAKEHGLRIEAWINPYRVRVNATSTASNPISANNPVNSYLNSNSDAVIQYNGGTSYNPASKAARNLITNGVVEIIENYDIDGIHFDDYFYPTTDVAFDAKSYATYKNSGGKLALADWRRENVNQLVRQVYAAVKEADPNVLFGISPQARTEINYSTQFADVEKWLSSNDYVDYICPQIYFGFDHEIAPFTKTLDNWNSLAQRSNIDLYVGLGTYKCGVADKGAKSGSNEWVSSNSMMKNMVDISRKRSEYAGFVIYRYDSLFRPEAAVKNHIAGERENLRKTL